MFAPAPPTQPTKPAAPAARSAALKRRRLARWRRLALGREHKRRLRTSQTLLATALVLACGLIGLVAALRADAPPRWAWLWFGSVCAGQLLMGLAVRSGLSERLADPALTQAQMRFTLVLTAAIYPLLGEMRAGTLPVFLLILCFGMFALRARQILRLATGSVLLLGLAMLVHLRWPLSPVDAGSEFGLFVLMGISMAGVSVLAVRMGRIRQRLRRQREQLAEALARIETLALRDALTGLYNRRHGEQLLREALARQARDRLRLHLVLLDLDHFKQVNDQHGHAAGDAVLRHFSGTLQDALRSTDAAVRWGGEEFLLLLIGDDWETPLERLRLAVAASQVVLPSGRALRYSFSGGLVAVQAGDAAERLLERADAALYRAKHAGRDLVLAG